MFWPRSWVLVVLGLGVLLRFPFVPDGLPYRYDSDENKRIGTATDMLARGSLNPGWFGHPAQTIIYPVAALTGSIYGVGRLVGTFDSHEAFTDWYHRDPTVVYLSVRTLLLLFSLAAIALTMLLAARVGGPTTAILAGFAVALSPIHISQSSLVRSSDIAMSLFLLLSAYFSLRILRCRADRSGDRPPWVTYGLGGLMVGFSVASKFYGVVGAAGIVAAHALRWGKDLSKLKLLWFAGLASLIGAFITGPFLFLDFPNVLAAVANENRTMHLSANGPGFFQDIRWFLSILGRQGLGPSLLAMAGIGVVVHLRNNWRESAVVLVAPVLLLLFMSALSLRWDRWILGLVPFAAIYAALPFSLILGWAKTSQPRILWTTGALGLICLGFGWNLRHSIQTFRALELPDTRDLAKSWIDENVPDQTTLFVEVHGPQLDRTRYRIVGNFSDSGEPVILDGTAETFVHPAPPTMILNLRSVDDLQRAGVEYVVLTSFEGRFRESPFKGEYEREIGLYDSLHVLSEVVNSWTWDGTVRGPPIQILRMRSLHESSQEKNPDVGR